MTDKLRLNSDHLQPSKLKHGPQSAKLVQCHIHLLFYPENEARTYCPPVSSEDVHTYVVYVGKDVIYKYYLGQPVGSDWTVTKIDSVKGEVVLTRRTDDLDDYIVGGYLP